MIGDITGLITPDATGVFEISDEFFLFCVDAKGRFSFSGETFPHTTDMAKLEIPFGALFEGALTAEGDSLAIGLEGISQVLEHGADPFVADRNSFSQEFVSDFTGRLAGPFQSGHGVASRFVFHQ